MQLFSAINKSTRHILTSNIQYTMRILSLYLSICCFYIQQSYYAWLGASVSKWTSYVPWKRVEYIVLRHTTWNLCCWLSIHFNKMQLTTYLTWSLRCINALSKKILEIHKLEKYNQFCPESLFLTQTFLYIL